LNEDKMTTITQQRVARVLERMIAAARRGPDEAQAYSDALEEMLDELHGNDGFGTEGQCDPRGDYRNGQWFMERVEGIDTRVKQSPDGTTQQRVSLVLERIAKTASEDENEAEMFSDALDEMLSAMQEDGDFGAGGEHDPRGDQRHGSWNMMHVQGIDAS
jgi:hypothetical protein